MRDLFTQPDLYDGLGDMLYVFEQCAINIRNEDVVEGMCSVLSAHADESRGQDPEAAEAEAFVHWNGPALVKADKVIEKALNLHFPVGGWHFSHVSTEGQQSPYSSESQVVRRHKRAASRLPFLGA
eukprot:GHVU01192002.1.p2 GENE.GHVU01192002.1~~GHVU01192002.1.p2  ORF type:complete len:126 (+),score=18.99 GHVU01192002.1:1066-1443(+)